MIKNIYTVFPSKGLAMSNIENKFAAASAMSTKHSVLIRRDSNGNRTFEKVSIELGIGQPVTGFNQLIRIQRIVGDNNVK